jgi:hypothetical protein
MSDTSTPWGWNPGKTFVTAYNDARKTKMLEEQAALESEMTRLLMPLKVKEAALQLDKLEADVKYRSAQVDRERYLTKNPSAVIPQQPQSQGRGYFGSDLPSADGAEEEATPAYVPVNASVGTPSNNTSFNLSDPSKAQSLFAGMDAPAIVSNQTSVAPASTSLGPEDPAEVVAGLGPDAMVASGQTGVADSATLTGQTQLNAMRAANPSSQGFNEILAMSEANPLSAFGEEGQAALRGAEFDVASMEKQPRKQAPRVIPAEDLLTRIAADYATAKSRGSGKMRDPMFAQFDLDLQNNYGPWLAKVGITPAQAKLIAAQTADGNTSIAEAMQKHLNTPREYKSVAEIDKEQADYVTGVGGIENADASRLKMFAKAREKFGFKEPTSLDKIKQETKFQTDLAAEIQNGRSTGFKSGDVVLAPNQYEGAMAASQNNLRLLAGEIARDPEQYGDQVLFASRYVGQPKGAFIAAKAARLKADKDAMVVLPDNQTLARLDQYDLAEVTAPAAGGGDGRDYGFDGKGAARFVKDAAVGSLQGIKNANDYAADALYGTATGRDIPFTGVSYAAVKGLSEPIRGWMNDFNRELLGTKEAEAKSR